MARGDGSEVNQSDGEVTLLCAPHSPSRVKRDQRKRRASKPARGWRWRESHRRPDEGRARGEPDRAGARGGRRDNVAGVGEVRRAGREAQCAGHGAGTLSSQRHLHDPIFACVASRSDDARPLAAGHRVRPLRRALRRGRARPLRRRRRGDLELGQRHVLGIARVCVHSATSCTWSSEARRPPLACAAVVQLLGRGGGPPDPICHGWVVVDGAARDGAYGFTGAARPGALR